MVEGSQFGEGAAVIFVREGGVWTEQVKLEPDPGVRTGFGYAVDIDGDTIAVGAYEPVGPGTGSVYIYVRSGSMWTLEQEITSIDGIGRNFGFSLALDGDTLLVGAPASDSFLGTAYVYTRSGSTWNLEQRLEAPSSNPFQLQGRDVALDGDTAVVAAPGDDEFGASSDAAYVWTRSAGSWTVEQKLLASDGGAFDEFGTTAAVDGDRILIGVPRDGDLFPNAGSAYVFERFATVWSQTVN